MKKLMLLTLILTIASLTKAQTSCESLPCPSLLNRPIIENFKPCGPGADLYSFDLAPGSSSLCGGESFTFTLYNSAGFPIQSGSNAFNLTQLCTGNYTICVTLNSPFRDCPPSCMSFYFVNRGEGCCGND